MEIVSVLNNSLGKTCFISPAGIMWTRLLKGVYELYLGSTKSPILELCQSFKHDWQGLDKNRVNPGTDDQVVMSMIREDAKDIVEFCHQQ